MKGESTLNVFDCVRRTPAKYDAVVRVTGQYLAVVNELCQTPPADGLPMFLRSATITVMNSLQSVLLLAVNGCGSDALKIARSMFETSVVMTFLQNQPESLDDYLTYLYVKQHEFQDYLEEHAPDYLRRIRPAIRERTVAQYEEVKRRFGKRRSWSRKTLRDMAKDVGLEQTYCVVYRLTSSIQHLDVLGLLIAQEEHRISDVGTVPPSKNIALALSIAGLSAYQALVVLDSTLGATHSERLRDWFNDYELALGKVEAPEL